MISRDRLRPLTWPRLHPGMAAVIASTQGLLLVSLGYAQASAGVGWPEVFYWVGLIAMFFPVAARTMSAGASRAERLWLLITLALLLYLAAVLQSPFGLAGHDELLHWRTLADIVHTSHLYEFNPLLIVSPLYPGLEIVAAAVAQATGVDLDTAGRLVIALARLMMILALFVLYEHAAGSSRLASLGALVYMASPSFFGFSASFAYESLALPLAVSVVALLAWRSSSPLRRSLGGISGWLVVIVTVTHHVTSYLLAGVLAAWTVLWRFRRQPGWVDRGPAAFAVLAAVAAGAWVLLVAQTTVEYLAPPLLGAAIDVVRLIAGEGQGRELFASATGQVSPLWDRVVGLSSSGLTAVLVLLGAYTAWRRFGLRPLPTLLVLLGLAYPVSLGLRFSAQGGEAGGRMAAILFVGVGFAIALAVRDVRARWLRRTPVAVPATVLTLLFVGGIVAGTDPLTRLPGPYLPSADARSITSEGLHLATWTRDRLPAGSRVAGDRVSRLLVGSLGGQRIVYHHSDQVETFRIFVGSDVDDEVVRTLDQGSVDYVVIDRRLSTGLPVVGFYFEEGEIFDTPHTEPIDPGVLGKWDVHPSVSRVYDSGNLQLYDVRALR